MLKKSLFWIMLQPALHSSETLKQRLSVFPVLMLALLL